jgi:hypothetical protein
VEDDVDALHGPREAIAVTHVPDQQSHVAPAAVALSLIELLGLVAAEHAHDLRLQAEQVVYQAGTDRARAARDENPAAAEEF